MLCGRMGLGLLLVLLGVASPTEAVDLRVTNATGKPGDRVTVIAELNNAVASDTSDVIQVWIDSLVLRIRYWSERGEFAVGEEKDPTPPGADRNGIEVLSGGVVASIE